MLGFVIISKTKLKEIESDAYNRGFQVARSVGYSEPTFRTAIDAEYRQPYTHGLTRNPQSVNLRTVTSDNTQAANKAVQEMHKRVDVAQRRTKRKAAVGYVIPRYGDKSVVLIKDGAMLESFIADRIGEMTVSNIAKAVKSKLGSHARGKLHPIKVSKQLISKIACRNLVWDAKNKCFRKPDTH